MKWFWKIAIGVVAVLITILLKTTKSNGDKLLNFLDKKKREWQNNIKVIDERMNKRKLAYEINKEKKLDMEKGIKRMPDNELDEFIKRNL
jgi:hypothetical protein